MRKYGLERVEANKLTSNYCEVKYRQLIFKEDRHVLDYSLVLDCRMFSGGLYSPKNRSNKFSLIFSGHKVWDLSAVPIAWCLSVYARR